MNLMQIIADAIAAFFGNDADVSVADDSVHFESVGDGHTLAIHVTREVYCGDEVLSCWFQMLGEVREPIYGYSTDGVSGLLYQLACHLAPFSQVGADRMAYDAQMLAMSEQDRCIDTIFRVLGDMGLTVNDPDMTDGRWYCWVTVNGHDWGIDVTKEGLWRIEEIDYDTDNYRRYGGRDIVELSQSLLLMD